MKKIIFTFLSLIVFLSFTSTRVFAEVKSSAPSASFGTIVQKVKFEDNRTKILKNFLQSYNSPLAPSSRTFIQMADRYELDWKLVAAISGVESGFAHKLPYNSYNAWGWGIYGNNVLRFSSYDEAIITISKSLRQDYLDKRKAQDIYHIGRIYASDPNWARKVIFFMNKIDEYALKNPTLTLSISI